MDDEDTTVRTAEGPDTETDDDAEIAGQSRMARCREELSEALLAFLGRISPHPVHLHRSDRR